MKLLYLILIYFLTSETYVSWTTANQQSGKDLTITFEGNIKEGWYIYGSKLEVKGPLVTKIDWEDSKDFKVVGPLEMIEPHNKMDEVWGGKINYFAPKAKFSQKIKILKPGAEIKGTLKYQACINDPEDGSCINEKYRFTIKTKAD